MSPVLEPYSFDPDTHTYREGGRVLPGLTSILDSAGLISPYAKDPDAAERGKLVHRACAMYDRGELGDAGGVTPWVDSWVRIAAQYCLVGIEIERPIFVPSIGFATTPDFFGYVRLTPMRIAGRARHGQPVTDRVNGWRMIDDSVLALIERKTVGWGVSANTRPAMVGPQTAGQHLAVHHGVWEDGSAVGTGNGSLVYRAVVTLSPTDHSFRWLEDEHDFDVFRSALTIYRFKRERG